MLTPRMIEVLQHARAGRPLDTGISGRSAVGGLSTIRRALYSRGFLHANSDRITWLGVKALDGTPEPADTTELARLRAIIDAEGKRVTPLRLGMAVGYSGQAATIPNPYTHRNSHRQFAQGVAAAARNPKPERIALFVRPETGDPA